MNMLDEIKIKKPANGKKKNLKTALPKQTINIIRTTQRNNIDLTAIADNKANVLLSLNAIMITFILPMVFAYLEVVIHHQLFIPLGILVFTCFTTIYLAGKVLTPTNFDAYKIGIDPNVKLSPFFFGNFYKMSAEQYYEYIQVALAQPDSVKAHLAQDLFYVGKRLGEKMDLIRRAFRLFILGIFLTLLSTAIVLGFF